MIRRRIRVTVSGKCDKAAEHVGSKGEGLVVRVRIFHPSSDSKSAFKPIKDPVSYSINGTLLTVVYTRPDGSQSTIKTTFPFIIEEGEEDKPGVSIL